jgi:ribosome maturation factor RimP
MAEIIEQVQSLLAPILEGTDIFLVNIRVKPINNIKVFLDADGGFSIEKCIQVNRKLYAAMEELQIFPAGDYSLEVSSPGVDEPLLQRRQYKKNIGRKVTVTNNEGTETTGMLTEVTDDHVILDVKHVKNKSLSIPTEIPFSNIKKTVVQIIF